MPEELESYEFPERRRYTKYDWDLLLNGKIWRMHQNVDFTCKPNSLDNNARTQAGMRDGHIRANFEGSKQSGDLVIQFVPGPAPDGVTRKKREKS